MDRLNWKEVEHDEWTRLEEGYLNGELRFLLGFHKKKSRKMLIDQETGHEDSPKNWEIGKAAAEEILKEEARKKLSSKSNNELLAEFKKLAN